MELEDNIKKDFANLMGKHKLSLSSLTPNSVRLENSFCIINLQLERGVEFYVTFVDKKTKREYPLMNLVFFKGLQDRKRITASSLFELHAKEIELYFSDLLLGDFTWSDEYEKYMNRYTL